ncbi:hypothetical protein KK092_07115 [Curtobacterium flaccumfaciens pv. flaccumfaciens]|uniref:hypothetical protein n=1 Tax=Curtobacterium flaccumfaciens TaxID=2035 RepID=UPI001BDF28C3|nr:hypothetical protein [Curtobacterium flaccumfaciens]MBT1669147.1 hypothetical protein [Curtobacterium flaccumfaciens pv. flaccumfaciens]
MSGYPEAKQHLAAESLSVLQTGSGTWRAISWERLRSTVDAHSSSPTAGEPLLIEYRSGPEDDADVRVRAQVLTLGPGVGLIVELVTPPEGATEYARVAKRDAPKEVRRVHIRADWTAVVRAGEIFSSAEATALLGWAMPEDGHLLDALWSLHQPLDYLADIRAGRRRPSS